MTDFSQSLCNVPKSLDQRPFLSEVNYVLAFMKMQKMSYHQVFEALGKIEKFYLAAHQQMSSLVHNASGESSVDAFDGFIEKRAKMADVYGEKGNAYSSLNANRTAPLKKDFDENYKRIKGELGKLKSIVMTGHSSITKSLGKYDKYITGLQVAVQSDNMIAMQKAQQMMDEKITRLQTQYVQFHESFSAYCEKRDEVFSNIDAFNAKMAGDITTLIRDADKIDNELFSDTINNIRIENKISFDVDDFWEDTYYEKPFKVKLIKTVTIDGVSLNPSMVFRCLDTQEYDWKVEANDKVYNIPCDLLIPYK